jgi:heat shock protein HslJ
MMACTEGMETEQAFMEALLRTRSWRIRGKHLDLLDTDGKVVAGFEAR